jgi:hypothetical protein
MMAAHCIQVQLSSFESSKRKGQSFPAKSSDEPVSEDTNVFLNRITHWGTSPKFLAALRQSGVQKNPKLDSLQVVSSAGSPLSTELYHWFYNSFPKHIALNSGSGGTDLVGGSE